MSNRMRVVNWLATSALVFALSAAAAARADEASTGTAAAAVEAYSPPPDGEPPPGTPEDQQLWRELNVAAATALVQLERVSQSSFRIRYGRTYEQLDATVALGGAAAKDAGELRARLAEAAIAADAALPKDGGRVRACRYTLLHFGQRMPFRADDRYSEELIAFRGEARECRDRMRGLAERVEPRANALEQVLADVDALISRTARPGERQP